MDLQNDIVHYHKLSRTKKTTTFLWLVVVFTCNKSRGSIYFIARDTEKLGPAIVFWQIGVLLWARFFLKHACEKICPFSSSLSTTVVVFYEKCCFCACHENYYSSILQALAQTWGHTKQQQYEFTFPAIFMMKICGQQIGLPLGQSIMWQTLKVMHRGN